MTEWTEEKSLSEILVVDHGQESHYALVMYGGLVEVERPIDGSCFVAEKSRDNDLYPVACQTFLFQANDITKIVGREAMGNLTFKIHLR